MNSIGKLKTESQQIALEKLTAYADLFFSERATLAGFFECRVRPLLVGPSGTGKSFLVRELAASYACPLFRATYGDWLVRGCKEGVPTITQIGVFVESNPRGIIHLDELDKVGKPQGGSDWMRSANVELYNLIDGRPTATDDSIENSNWDTALQKKFRRFFLVIGTATFQALFQQRPNTGFIRDWPVSPNWHAHIKKRLRQQEEISPELLERFNDAIILIPPLTKAEARRMLELIREAQPDPLIFAETTPEELADQAVASGSNIRFFEELMTDLALQAQVQQRSGTVSVNCQRPSLVQ